MKKREAKIKTKKRGSVLIYTLFLLMISLILGLSLISSSIAGRRSSFSTGRSVHSFQVADSGLEFAFMQIREKSFSGPGNTFAGVYNKGIGDVFSDCDLSGGFVKYDTGRGLASLYFYKDATQINCDDTTKKFSDINKIKSVGTHNGISRSVEAGGLSFVAP